MISLISVGTEIKEYSEDEVKRLSLPNGRDRAGNLIGVSRLAFPAQLVEITFRAVVGGAQA